MWLSPCHVVTWNRFGTFCDLVLYFTAGTTAALGLLICLPQFTWNKVDMWRNKVNTEFNSSWLLLEYACISQRSLQCLKQNLQCDWLLFGLLLRPFGLCRILKFHESSGGIMTVSIVVPLLSLSLHSKHKSSCAVTCNCLNAMLSKVERAPRYL